MKINAKNKQINLDIWELSGNLNNRFVSDILKNNLSIICSFNKIKLNLITYFFTLELELKERTPLDIFILPLLI